MRSICLLLVLTHFALTPASSVPADEPVADAGRRYRNAATDRSIEAARNPGRVFFRNKASRDKRFDAGEEIASHYGLVITALPCAISRHKDMQAEYTWRWPDDRDDEALAITVSRLRLALSRYPPDYLAAIGLRAIIIVKDLRWNGNEVGGGYDSRDGVIIATIDVSVLPEYIEHAFHHELFHMMQVRYYRTGILSEDKWRPLLAPGTQYRKTGINDFLKGRKNAHTEHPEPGLVSAYASSDYMHDQTELFCYMMVPEKSARLEGWMKSDESLRKKEAFLRAAASAISPDFKRSVFDSIREQGRVSRERNAISWSMDGTGLHVTTANVLTPGHAGKTVYAYIQLSAGVFTAQSPAYHEAIVGNDKTASTIHFTVPISDLQTHFGKGNKKITMRFAVASGPGKLVEGTFREISIDIKVK